MGAATPPTHKQATRKVLSWGSNASSYGKSQWRSRGLQSSGCPPAPLSPRSLSADMKEELIRENDVIERELMDSWKMENIDLKKSLFLMEHISDQMFKKGDPNILERIFLTFFVHNTVMSV